MEYSICYYTYIPLRAEPSEKSEMVSQILFGEIVEVLEENNDKGFCFIRNTFDNYTGWCNNKLLYPLSIEEYNHHKPGRVLITTEIVTIIKAVNSSDNLYLSAGSTLSLTDDNFLKIFNKTYHVDDSLIKDSRKSKISQILDSALKFINVPYLWGGRSSFGTDCSGFIQNIFKQAGIALSRDARQQFLHGAAIDNVEDALPGDLMYFHNENKEITHTGLYIGNNQIIHASGSVKADKIDDKGIISATNRIYTHYLAGIKRIL